MQKKILASVAALAVLAGVALVGPSASAVTATAIAGKGSSFANGALQYCLSHYDPTSGDTVTYTSTGSGTGRTEFAAGSIAWAATDAPYSSGAPSFAYKTIPLVGGPVVFAYNKNSGLPAGLKLDAPTISKIYKGTITRWNDAAIKALNPGKTLPSAIILAYYRATGSGTTANLTKYLASNSGSAWTSGSNDLRAAAGGTLNAHAYSKSTSSVIADKVEATKYAFGYFDLSDAASANVNKASLKNAAGQFIAPSASTGALFLNGQTTIRDTNSPMTDGTLNIDFAKRISGAYQLTVVTYGLAPVGSTEKSRAVEGWFKYVVNTCMPARAAGLGYVPLSGALKTSALAQINAIY